MAKTHFSCTNDPAIGAKLEGPAREQGRDHAVIAGIEAHVCVLQTALGLPKPGFGALRRGRRRHLAPAREPRSGARPCGPRRVEVVTTEMVLFEWFERAGTEEFKELSAPMR